MLVPCNVSQPLLICGLAWVCNHTWVISSTTLIVIGNFRTNVCRLIQHCLDTSKLNKQAECLNLATNNQPVWIESNSSLLTCAKACFSAILSFTHLMRCEANVVVSYCVVPYWQCCYAWVIMSNAVHNYWKCSINVATWTYILGVLLIYLHSPSVLRILGSCVLISAKPLTAVL